MPPSIWPKILPKIIKPQKILLLGAFVGLMILSGCSKDETYEDNGTESLANTESYGAAEESTSVQAYDSTAESEQFQQAIINLDLSKCEGIENQVLKDACVTNVALAMAKQNKDESACDLIKDEDAKTYCLDLASESEEVISIPTEE